MARNRPDVQGFSLGETEIKILEAASKRSLVPKSAIIRHLIAKFADAEFPPKSV
jgi:hypothetical protein